jgi:hypothetical protein
MLRIAHLLTSFRLDISSSSPHTRRRIWQEAITALFLTSPDCKIPDEQPMHYIQARNSEFPPYLVSFQGSPGERHVENIKVSGSYLAARQLLTPLYSKILREVGTDAYNKAIAISHRPLLPRLLRLTDQIQRNFVGPDCYWRSLTEHLSPGSTRCFGNAWWLPFPPTLVRYDMN